MFCLKRPKWRIFTIQQIGLGGQNVGVFSTRYTFSYCFIWSAFVFGALSDNSWFWLSDLLFLDTDAHDWADQYQRRGYLAYAWQEGNLYPSCFLSFHPAPLFLHLCTICSILVLSDCILVLPLQVSTHETSTLIKTMLGSSVHGSMLPRLDWNSWPLWPLAATLACDIKPLITRKIGLLYIPQGELPAWKQKWVLAMEEYRALN